MELLERGAILEQFGALLSDAAGGHGSLLFLGGEAGIGKTAVVRELCRTAAARARVLNGACDPLSTPQPLGPLLDIARAAGGELARLLQSGAARNALFHAFHATLSAGARPSLVVIEDVHWADEATLDLLRFLGRRIAATHALLLVTYRDDEVGVSHPLRMAMGDLATSGAIRRLTLSPLSAAAVRALARESELDAADLHRRTGGNPFFVTEAIAAGGRGVPPTVRDAVLARAARLTLSARTTLDAAAVIGARVEPWLLTALGAATEAMDECAGAGMLHTQGTQLAFRHEIAREAVLEALPPHLRTALHAAALTALRSRAFGPDALAQLAHHAEAAGDRDAVLEYAPAAAQHAVAAGAHREAVAQYARALRVADALPAEEHGLLLEAYADQCAITELLAEAIDAHRTALALWQRLGNGEHEVIVRSKLVSLLVRAARNDEAEQMSADALALLGAETDDATQMVAYRAHSALRMLNRDNAEAIAWGEKALVIAERIADVAALAGTLNMIGSARLLSGDDHGRVELERSVQLAHEAGLPAHAVNALLNLASSYGELYQFQAADRYLAEGLAYATERDLDNARLYMLAWQALSHLFQGRWGAAAEAAATVLRHPTAAAISRIMALAAVGRVRARRGDPEVWDALDEALTLAAPTGTLQRLAPVRAARAEAAWLAGDRERTRTEARAVYEMAVAHQHPWFTGEFAYWRWLAGDLDPAELPAWSAEPYARQIAGDWRAAAELWRALGCPYEAARALAEGEEEAAMKQALTELERLGARPAATALARRLREQGARGIPRGPRPATRAHPASLTPREVEIVRLLGAGLRNAEIAARLSLSTKTVDHHVSAILGKLDARTRTEAAGMLAALEHPRPNGDPAHPQR